MPGKALVVSLGAALAVLITACSPDLTRGDECAPSIGFQDTTITAQVTSGLVQRVTISSLAPCPGEDITIMSELEVTATDSMFVTSRMCGLDFDGSLDTAQPPHLGICLGYSIAHTYAPGAVIRSGQTQRIQSGPGTYTLEIRHLLSPSRWITVPVTVRGE